MKRCNSQKGFTLIEMLIAVAIVGILSAIAYPAYTAAVLKSNRAEVKADLTDIAQRLQRCYTTYGVFNNASCPVYTQIANQPAPGVPTTGHGYYTIKFSTNPAVTATTYQLEASVDTSKSQSADKACYKFIINQRGVKTSTNSGGGNSPDCWVAN